MKLDVNFYKVRGIVNREDLSLYYEMRDLKNRVIREVEREENKKLGGLKGKEGLKLANKIVSRINSRLTRPERKFLAKKKNLIDNAILIGYFRKHFDLNTYILENFVDLGDYPDGDFNRKYIVLKKDMLEELLNFSRSKIGEIELANRGHLDGRSNLDDWIETVEFLERVLKEVDFSKESVLYDSWR